MTNDERRWTKDRKLEIGDWRLAASDQRLETSGVEGLEYMC